MSASAGTVCEVGTLGAACRRWAGAAGHTRAADGYGARVAGGGIGLGCARLWGVPLGWLAPMRSRRGLLAGVGGGCVVSDLLGSPV